MRDCFPFVLTEISMMIRYVFTIIFTGLVAIKAASQRVLTKEEAVDLALQNQRNLKAATLTAQQQQQLLRGSAGLKARNCNISYRRTTRGHRPACSKP